MMAYSAAVSKKPELPAFLSLMERVRKFNLGTPTPMHVGTHKLVNDLWRELDATMAELHLLGMNLHNLSIEVANREPCLAVILERYAKRIDELMARAPEREMAT